MEHPPNKDKNSYKHPESQSSRTQIPRHQCRNSNISGQENMPPPEHSNSITVGLKKCNVTEAQHKDFKITIKNMFKDVKEVTKSVNSVKAQTVE